MLQRSNMVVLLLALIIYANPALSQLENNEFGEVKPTPVLKQNHQDVATVLVADINNRGAHGRFINIKPEIGLLKSTARTFIQDGIKTEYVTKVIGTTIDNGQYVQLLTTTSRVLYNSDNQQTKTVNFNSIDGNDEASFLNSPPSSPFLQNVDYIVPNNPYLVFPARNSRNNNDNNNVINFNNLNINDNDNEESEIAIKAEKLVESPRAAQIPQPAKVIPEGNLPTYTVSHDGPIFEAQAPKFNSAPRVGKVISYEDELKEAESAPKILPSVTYFGFADFTTTVGDTVIIFSPSTVKPQIDKDHITSIKGEPTLSIRPTTTKQQHITFEEAESSLVEPRFTPKIAETAMPTLPTTPEYKETTKSEVEEEETTTKESTTTSRKPTTITQETTTEEIFTTTNESEEEEDSFEETEIPTTTSEKPTEKPTEKPSAKPIIRFVGVTTPESIESSQVSPITTPKYTKPSEEDLQRILASLASQKVNEEKSSVIDTSPIVSSNAETKVLSGTSIIFFDYDEPEITTQKTELVTLPSSTTNKAIIATEADETSDEEEEDDDDEEEESTSQKQQPEIKVEEETTTEAITVKPLTPRPAEIEDKEGCSSTMLQTLKFLTTFYVPQDEIITTTSVKTRQVIATKVVPIECSIKPTSVTSQLTATKYVTEDINTEEEEVTHAADDDKESENTTTVKAITQKPETTTMEIVTESSTVEEETTVENLEDEEDIEVIYKTLYTTYTYLTTFFQESTSTVSSRKDVITNVVTSTINANDFASLLSKFEPLKPEDDPEIRPTQVDHGVGRPTEKYILPESDFIGVNLLLDSEKVEYTPALTDDDIGNEIKTLYTTYTYFTTLFNEGTTELATRTEVYTNIINPSSSLANVLQRDVLESKFVDIEKDDNSLADSRKEGKKLKIESEIDENDIKYSTMIRNASELSQNGDDSDSTWDDVKSSTSEGERSYIENIDRRHYTELEDQISSESNIEEGIPSPTLLLQTRYTTFTYYTTVYTGGSSSSILSRLETLTNVVTETLSPTQVQKLDDATVPVTYFTTFTYWTTFYKDGKTETTSREETLSNVITPSLVAASIEQESTVEIVSSLPTHVIQTDLTTSSSSSSVLADSTLLVQPLQPVVEPAIIESSSLASEIIEPSQVVVIDENEPLEPSTLYTTYTYFTTNYVGDATVIDSRFETETNIVTPSVVLTEQKSGARAIDVNGGKANGLDSDEKGKKILIDGEKPVVENKETIEVTPALETVKLLPTGVVSINHGKIIDAEGISTTHFTTQAVGTYVDNLYAEVIESSTSIEIDEIRKAIQPTELEGSTRHHKTGLVRLIDGTIVNKNETTLYESKVIGTFIDGRYAQLIESTSSIILAKQIEPTAVDNRVNIEPTAANGEVVTPSTNDINPTPAVLEGSIIDSASVDEIEDDKSKSRPLFPVKRPFGASINRPFGASSRTRSTFNPTFKRKNTANTAAIITPTEVTPTIKATAVKSLTNRFAAPRRSSALTSAFSPSSSIQNVGGPSSARRPSFTRPSSVRQSFQPTSSIRASKPSSSRIQPTSILPSSIRRPLLRSSLPVAPRASSSISPSLPVIGRNRNIRPSSSIVREVVQASITTPEPDEFETTLVTDDPSNADDIESESQEPVTTTTENSRRSNNPLLKVRRPPLTSGARPNPPAATQRSVTITTRRNPLARTSRATTQTPTTTTTERTTRNRPLFRPTFAPVSIGGSRSRPSNLFPNRRTTTEPPQALDEEDINNSEEDYDTEETKIQEVKTPARSRGSRSKRQAIDYGTRPPNYNPRLFKKPTTSRNSRADYYTYDSEELIVTEPPKTRAATSRYNAQRSRGSSNYETETAKTRIKPTTSSSQSNNRLLFTLRKEDTSPVVTQRSSNFRRPQPASSFNSNANNRRTTTTTRASKFRYNQQEARGNNANNARGRNSNSNTRGRGTTSRSRTRDDAFNYVAPKFDGTITVTHHIPTEVTIPIVVGKNTEYKAIITAKPSLETLGPNQYSTSNGKNGQTTLVVLEARTAINQNGATEITQFILSETPTTSITFTPTTIRGRKTSFSHVIPSTVYDAHPVISTIQPQILPGSGSLANILLSQLLLSPQNQQLGALGLGNPLLGLNQQIQQVVPQMPATPVTEYKTRTTTYVTTIHEGKSTVLPITFRGMKIYTTVFDDVSQVITATEFITDTVVITPTQAFLPQVQQTANLNSLLLPLLLQQQQQQQQQFNLQNINTQPAAFDILKPQLEGIADDKTIQSITADETQNNSKEEDYEEVEEKPKKYFKAPKPIEKKYETSVVTIYVSGRVPGDFSTVLSTIITENPVYKRSASYVDVKASALPNLDVLEAEASDNYYEYVLSGSSNDIEPEPRDDTNKETESLDVVFGDYNKYTSSVLM